MTFSPILTSKILHRRSEAAVMHTEWSCAAARVCKRAGEKMREGGNKKKKKLHVPTRVLLRKCFIERNAE